MNRQAGIANGIIVAAGIALCATIMVTGLSTWWGTVSAIYFTAPALALAYLLIFLHSRRAATGKVIAITCWGAFAFTAWWLAPALPVYLLLHAAAIWLVRSLFAYSSLLQAIADGFLTFLAALAFSWAFTRTGSIFLSAWSFFLVQSLWTLIPGRFSQTSRKPAASCDKGFDHAQRQADAALRQLFNR